MNTLNLLVFNNSKYSRPSLHRGYHVAAAVLPFGLARPRSPLFPRHSTVVCVVRVANPPTVVGSRCLRAVALRYADAGTEAADLVSAAPEPEAFAHLLVHYPCNLLRRVAPNGGVRAIGIARSHLHQVHLRQRLDFRWVGLALAFAVPTFPTGWTQIATYASALAHIAGIRVKRHCERLSAAVRSITRHLHAIPTRTDRPSLLHQVKIIWNAIGLAMWVRCPRGRGRHMWVWTRSNW